MPMNIMLRAISIALSIIAAIQLFGISEKITHALWQWYKFYGYSNNGHIGNTTLDVSIVIFTYIASISAIFVGFIICKKSPDKPSRFLAKYSAVSLTTGIIALSILLISPIGQLVHR